MSEDENLEAAKAKLVELLMDLDLNDPDFELLEIR